jgi:hypothetical protein
MSIHNGYWELGVKERAPVAQKGHEEWGGLRWGGEGEGCFTPKGSPHTSHSSWR